MPSIALSNTFSPNTKIKSAEVNQNFTDNRTFSGVRAYHSVVQAIANGGWTRLFLDSENFDTDNYHSNTVNNFYLTVPVTGYYNIFGLVTFTANAAGYRGVYINKLGSVFIYGNSVTAVNGGVTQVLVQTVHTLNAGDTVSLYAYQSSGGALNVAAGADTCVFHMIFCGT